MGRWAQRRRGGGGPTPGGPTLLSIEDASIDGTTKVQAVYTGQISAAGFDAGDFTSLPTNESSVSYANLAEDVIEITFGASIAGDEQLEYGGDKAGVVTPQTVDYTV